MRFSPSWWAYWAGVCAVGLTAAAAIAGIVAWYFANVAAAESEGRTRALELRVAEQQERAAKAELELLEVRRRLNPRRIVGEDKARLTTALQSATLKGPVEVAFPIGDGEAAQLARDLIASFQAAGWEVSDTPTGELFAGVGVFLQVNDPHNAPGHAMVVGPLLERLFEIKRDAEPRPELPTSVVRILVLTKE